MTISHVALISEFEISKFIEEKLAKEFPANTTEITKILSVVPIGYGDDKFGIKVEFSTIDETPSNK